MHNSRSPLNFTGRILIIIATLGMLLVNPSSKSNGNAGYDFGLIFPSEVEGTRWKREAAYIQQILIDKGYTVDYRTTNDQTTEDTMIAEMVTEGIKVLIVVPVDRGGAVGALEAATQAGVKVIAYDRLIPSTLIAAYVSFNNYEIGRQQAAGILKALDIDHRDISALGTAKLVELGGSSVDNNSYIFRKGQDDVLAPYIASGKVKIVAKEWVENWDPNNAYTLMQTILSTENNKIDGVVASNDDTALGALNALTEKGLAGTVKISGQDATVDGCKSILKGDLALSILKDGRLMAPRTASLAIKLFMGESDPILKPYHLSDLTNDPNLEGIILADFLSASTIDKDNLLNQVIKSGYQAYDDVYADIPVDQRPPRPEMTITAIDPKAGAATGNEVIVLTGLGFQTGATVTIGGTAVTKVTVMDQSIIIAITGAHATSIANVAVTNPDTTSAILPNAYQYMEVQQTQVTTDVGGQLTATTNLETIVNVPAYAVSANTSLVYTATEPPPYDPAGFDFAGHSFTLRAFQDNTFIHPFIFAQPVTVTIHYSDADVAGMNESMLKLAYWTGSGWADSACGLYDRHPTENWLSVPICHLSQFALFQVSYQIMLPMVLR